MKILGIHTEGFKFKVTERALASAERRPLSQAEIEKEALVIFISVEEGDEVAPYSLTKRLASDVLARSEKLRVPTVVLYPYVHLTSQPSKPKVALEILKALEEILKEKLEVIRAPFGWYKSFTLSGKGHPLSEWRAEYSPQDTEHSPQAEVEKVIPKRERSEREEPKKASKFTRFVLVDLEGKTTEVTPSNFKQAALFKESLPIYQLLKQFVSNELEGRQKISETPKHIIYMQQHELIDYCEVSEKGHYKWYPKGLLIQKLILDYAARVAQEWGAVEVKNPLLIRGDNNIVGELMGEFHERDYQVDGGRGICYLRYASDPLGFPFMQSVKFSYKQSPLKIYEEATCFRNEQEGEVSGLKRVRNFLMTDMHAACKDLSEAKQEFETLCYKFGELMNNIITRGRWVLGWEGTIDFFEENKKYLVNIGRKLGVPAFFKLMPEMTHYYVIKNEYQSINEDGSNIQISTVQWDVKDGARFNIGYIDEHGRKHPCPVIIHASSFGSIERALCSILENIAIDVKEGKKALFPFWLAPTQVRIINVSDDYLKFAISLCDRLSYQNIRVDVDDRRETVNKKVRTAEQEWVPYLLVVGKKEEETGKLTVRERETGEQKLLEIEKFIKLIKEKQKGMPFRTLPLPKLLSQRVIFRG